MKTLKPQIESLDNLSEHLNKIIVYLEDAKKAQVMPSFFEYLSPNNVHTLEHQNQRLKKQVNDYEEALSKVADTIERVINVLKGFKE